jgi:hypothetical protein
VLKLGIHSFGEVIANHGEGVAADIGERRLHQIIELAERSVKTRRECMATN